MGLDYRILGPFEVVGGGRSLPLGSRQQRVLLAILLVRRNELVTVDELADLLWGEAPPGAARNTIQTYVSRLRRALPPLPPGGKPILETREPGYLLRVQPGELDADRFARLSTEGRRALGEGDAETAARTLRRALDLWRGPALVDFRYEAFAAPEIQRLEEARARALEDRIEADLQLGRHADLVEEIERVLAADPLRERSWEQLLRALHASGRPIDAARAYERAQRALRDELGVEPSTALRRLAERIREGDPSLRPPPTAPAHNLPFQPTTFVGRDGELADVAALLERVPLLTLVGVGGAGKTRLAVEAGRHTLDRFANGAWLVDLAAVGDARHVPQAVAAALRVRGQPGQSLMDVVVAALAPRTALVILDNCEHVVGAVAHVARAILAGCPGVRVLATSREPLGVPGETLLDIPPLPVPTSDPASLESIVDAPAVRLLLDRARAALPGLDLRPEDAATLARICRRLDGIPLAIELAATRVRLLSFAQLERRLSDRFRLLDSGRREASTRHETLRATLDWSYDLLAAPEQTLLHRLAVFAGSFALDEVEAICAGDGIEPHATIGLLGRLVDRSLVVAERAGQADVRCRLLETIRQYADERLASSGDQARMRDRHLAYFLGVAETANRELRGPGQAEWLERIRMDEPNLRGALDWALERGDGPRALRLSAALLPHWQIHGYGLRSLEAALEVADAATTIERARAEVAAGFLAVDFGEHDRARRHGEEGLRLFHELADPGGVAWATHLLGATAMFQGDYAAARTLLDGASEAFRLGGDDWHLARVLHHVGFLERLRGDYEASERHHSESLRLFREAGDDLRSAYALWSLGVVARYRGSWRAARERCEEGLRSFERLGDLGGVAHARNTIADIARLEGDADLAEATYRQALAEFRREGDRRCEASALANLGAVARRRADPDRARETYAESLAIRRDLRDLAGIAESLEGLAGAAVDSADDERAVALFGAATEVRTSIGAVLAEADRSATQADLERARARLGEAAFASAWGRGSTMGPIDAAVFALGDSIPGVIGLS
jgi:predicted ATPase/DNA-binding SARP family transcriptional activator